MTIYLRTLASLSFASALAVFTGCADKPAEAPTTEETVTVEEVEVPALDTAAPAATDGAAMDAASTEITAAMAELGRSRSHRRAGPENLPRLRRTPRLDGHAAQGRRRRPHRLHLLRRLPRHLLKEPAKVPRQARCPEAAK